MEDLIMPPTTIATTNLYYQEQPRPVRNPQTSNMFCAQNDPIFSNGEAHGFASASSMPHSHFHHTSYFPQSHNQTLQFPYKNLHENVVPLVFPAYPYQVEGSGIRTRAPNLSLRGFPDKVFSNCHVGDMVQSNCSMQPLGLSEFEEQRKLQSSICKAARSNRMLARQRSGSLQKKTFGGSSSSSLTSSSIRKLGTRAASQKDNNSYQKDLYTFCTADNKKLRVLLQKELTSSDVGTLGRIVLPKREAERYLPNLVSKEGIPMVIRDVYSNQDWQIRYRFWSNHKGRIYILDQLGDFVKQNGLVIGDHITLYEDKTKILYFSTGKTEGPAPEPSNEPTNTYHSNMDTPFTLTTTDEEDSSLKILMEELEHTEQYEANSLMTLYTDGASSTHS